MADSYVFDSSEAAEHFFLVPGDQAQIYQIIRVIFWIRFREFTAPATAAASGGGATSSAAAGHNHRFAHRTGTASTPGVWSAYEARNGDGGPTFGFIVGLNPGADLWTYEAAGAHDHTVPAHSHGLTYGIFKEPMPASIDVNLGLWRKPFEGGAWELFGSISGLDQEEQLVDLTSFFNNDEPGVLSGLYRMTIQSAPGQPQGGRLTADVVGTGWLAVQSA